MSPAEVTGLLASERTLTLATLGPAGLPHLVAMWYAVLDGRIWLETKARSQKAVNLRRDGRLSCLVEAGQSYPTLRGVSLEGRGRLVEDAALMWRIGVSLHERYVGVYDESSQAQVEASVRNRVAVEITVDRVRSWDHRKLGLTDPGAGGSTWSADLVRGS